MSVPNRNGEAECFDVTLRSFRYVDAGNATASIECFTDEVVLDRYGDITVGREKLLRALTEREKDVTRATCHAVVNYRPVEVLENVSIEADYALLVFQAAPGAEASQLVGVRLCFDRYLKSGDRWLIDFRRQEHLGLAHPFAAAKDTL